MRLGRRVLLGEVKWSARTFNRRSLETALRELASRPAPAGEEGGTSTRLDARTAGA
jgi:hypothetical protein